MFLKFFKWRWLVGIAAFILLGGVALILLGDILRLGSGLFVAAGNLINFFGFKGIF